MDPLAELAGESPVMEAVRDQIRRLLIRRETGRRLPSILISGETGTGKGLAARTSAWGRAPAVPSWTSTAPRSPRPCSKRSSSGSSAAPSPTRVGRNPASSRLPIAGQSFWMRSGSCRSPSRPSCSRSSKSKPCAGSGPRPQSLWIPGSSARPTPISRPRCVSASSARTFTTGWRC
jgi:hypothetical protein